MKAKAASVVVVAITMVWAGLVSPRGSRAAEQLPSIWRDCADAADEYCVETLAHTPEGSNVEQILTDAVADPANAPSHPNMHVSISATGSTAVYGKSLASLGFEVVDPTSRPLGAFTKTGIQPGRYRLVLRTGTFRPHSMTIKGKPDGDAPFVVTKGDDGNYTWGLTASSEAFVTLMDSTKWPACRSAVVDPVCEADTAFVRKLSGILVLVPPNYAETTVSPVSPSVDVTQGLWVASNTMVLDVKPEMNLITKSLHLPTYGPHFVPPDFPTAGLKTEGARHLNPAYFEAFVPNDLAAFMANFSVSEVAAKLPAAVKTTVESAEGGSAVVKEVEHPHSLDITARGGRVRVLLEHFSAPNPRVYVGGSPTAGAPSGPTTGASPSTTIGSASSSEASDASTVVPPRVLGRGKTYSAASVARRGGVSIPKKSVVVLVQTQQRSCVVRKGRLTTLRAGTCRLSLQVSNRPGVLTKRFVRFVVR